VWVRGWPASLRPVQPAVPPDFGDAVNRQFLKLSYNMEGSDGDVFKRLNARTVVRPTPQPLVFVPVSSSMQQLYDMDKAKSVQVSREFSCLFTAGIQGQGFCACIWLCVHVSVCLHVA
jgi:hypothetical protein